MKKLMLLIVFWGILLGGAEQNIAQQDLLKTAPNAKPHFRGGIPKSKLGAKITSSANTANKLPFRVDKNYPRLYIIPPNLRPAIMNQGNCGSCVAYAVSAAMATRLYRQRNVLQNIGVSSRSPKNNIRLLPNSLFSRGGRSCNNGWFIDQALDFVKDKGAIVNINRRDKNLKINKWGSIKSSSNLPQGVNKLDAMRKYISTRGALVADFDVRETLNYYGKTGIYSHRKYMGFVNSNPVWRQAAAKLDKSVGAHAVAVVGYFTGGRITLGEFSKALTGRNAPLVLRNRVVNAPPFWVVQNSWGSNWGLGGIVLMESGDAIGLDDEMYYIENIENTAPRTPVGSVGQYRFIRNAAIPGNNTRSMNGSVSQCKKACDGFGWCKSFDYHKGKNRCDLSNKSSQEVRLKTNYRGNPYNHYAKIPSRTTTTPTRTANSCRPNANQVAIFTNANYQGSCKVLNVGNYSTAGSFGLRNDSISSILTGRNVKAMVCRDNNYKGVCETVGGSASFLRNNRIGNDQVSSMKVFKTVESVNPSTNRPRANHAPPNSKYRFCAREGQNCKYGGIVRIAYGVNRKFKYKSFRSRETGPGRYVSTSTVCNSRNFGGDPAPGVPKRCYIQARGAGSTTRAITGRNVKIVRFNGGTFRQVRNGKTWVEYKSNNVEHARFTEIRRDSWNVYLRKSDGARIQLDLRNKVIKLNGRRLYTITSVWAP